MSDVNSQDLSQEILASPAKASIFLTVTIRSGGEAQVIDLLTGVSGLTRAVGFRYPETMLSCVVGIGAGMWTVSSTCLDLMYLHDSRTSGRKAQCSVDARRPVLPPARLNARHVL